MRVKLRGGKVALIDEADASKVGDHKWEVSTRSGRDFATTRVKIDGRNRTLHMSQLITGVKKVTHVNDNTLDNRRLNMSWKGLIAPLSTLAKGSLAEAAVIKDLYRYGFSVLKPFDGHCPYDMVAADKVHNLRRLQVKYRAAVGSHLELHLHRVHTNGRGVQVKPIDMTMLDAFAIYCPNNDRVYYVKAEGLAGKATLWLALDDQHLNDPSGIFHGVISAEKDGEDRMRDLQPIETVVQSGITER